MAEDKTLDILLLPATEDNVLIDYHDIARIGNEFFEEWAEIKAKLASYLGKMKDSWEKESSIEEDLGYFG